MSKGDFLVTAILGRHSRRFVWDGEEPTPLDHPACWVLQKTEAGVQVADVSAVRGDGDANTLQSIRGDGDANTLQPEDLQQAPGVIITTDELAAGARVDLPAPRGATRTSNSRNGLRLEILPLRPIRAAYLPAPDVNSKKERMRPSQLVIFSGMKGYVVGYRRLGEGFRGYIERTPIFSYFRAGEGGYQVTALREGVVLSTPDSEISLQVGVPEYLSDDDLIQSTVSWGTHWWRVNRIAIPPPMPMFIGEEEDTQRERMLMQRITQGVCVFFALLWMVAMFVTKMNKEKVVSQPQKIELKAPKIIPKLEEPPKPEPPKPEPKKPEPPKPKPKPKKPQPPPKAKKPTPPKKAAPPPPAPKAPPKPTAPPPPKASPKPAAPPAPSAAQVKAKQQQDLAKSLNFLSPSLNKASANISNVERMATAKASSKYNTIGSGVPGKKSSVLSNMAQSNSPSDGPIDTKAARNINGRVGFSGGRGKALNGVQAKVSLSDLASESGGGDFGGSLNGKGLSMSGEGNISEGLLMKVLQKYLQKFQYCYEKALLTDASLAGTVLMQWTIDTGGSAGNVKVVRSAMNNAGLHSCLSRELQKIHFPVPKGGSVTVKYPFAFSSSSL